MLGRGLFIFLAISISSVTLSLAGPCDEALRTKYKQTSMLGEFVGEAEGKLPHYHTRYLYTEAERAPYRVSVRHGLLYDSNGELLDTTDGWIHDREHGLVRGKSIFVMDGAGHFYWVKQDDATFYHSTFLAGGPLASGGEWSVHRGVIQRMSDRSGHYLKGKDQMFFNQALTELRAHAVNTSRIRVEYTLPEFNDDFFVDF